MTYQIDTERQTLDYLVYYTNQLNQPKSNLILNKYLFIMNLIAYINDRQFLFGGRFKQYAYGPTDSDMYKPYDGPNATKVTKVEPVIWMVEKPVIEFIEIKFDKNQIEPRIKQLVQQYLPNLITYPDMVLLKYLTAPKNTPQDGTAYTETTYEQVAKDYQTNTSRFWEHKYQTPKTKADVKLTINSDNQIINQDKPFLLTSDLMLRLMANLLSNKEISLQKLSLKTDSATQINKLAFKHGQFGKLKLNATGKVKNKDDKWTKLLIKTLNQIWQD